MSDVSDSLLSAIDAYMDVDVASLKATTYARIHNGVIVDVVIDGDMTTLYTRYEQGAIASHEITTRYVREMPYGDRPQ